MKLAGNGHSLPFIKYQSSLQLYPPYKVNLKRVHEFSVNLNVYILELVTSELFSCNPVVKTSLVIQTVKYRGTFSL